MNIDFYFAPTPNGQKISIMLEEIELPYNLIPVNLMKGEQLKPEFLKISPYGKIPAIIDHEGPEGKSLSLFESGAILVYLAEKTGKFLPEDTQKRYEALSWLMFQMASVGPSFGQTHHYMNYAPEKIEYVIQRCRQETRRIYHVLNHQLEKNEYLAGEYSVADIATWPWLTARKAHGQNLEEVPHVRRWYETIKQRPKLRKGFALLREHIPQKMDREAKKILYGIKKEKKK